MNLAEAPIQGLLDAVGKHIGERQNIDQAIVELRANPGTFARIAWQLDTAIEDFNIFVNPSFSLGNREIILLPNTLRAREVFSAGQQLPNLDLLISNPSQKDFKHGVKALKDASKLMACGESEPLGDNWKFHQDTTNVEDLTSAMLLEVYGLFINELYPELAEEKINPVICLEEIIAANHTNTDLFIAVKKWYTEEEGFSPKLVELVRGIDEATLKRQRPTKENPEYSILEVTDPDAILTKDAHFVDLGVETLHKLMRELKLQGLLTLRKNRSEKIHLVRWEGWRAPNGMVVGDKKVAWIQDGFAKDSTGEIIGTYDRIIDSGGPHGDLQLIAIYTK